MGAFSPNIAVFELGALLAPGIISLSGLGCAPLSNVLNLLCKRLLWIISNRFSLLRRTLRLCSLILNVLKHYRGLPIRNCYWGWYRSCPSFEWLLLTLIICGSGHMLLPPSTSCLISGLWPRRYLI